MLSLTFAVTYSFLCGALLAPLLSAAPLTEREAVERAVASSRELLAARLSVDQSDVDREFATLWSNPELSYSLGNLVLGTGNPQGMNVNPGFFDQTVHTVALSQTLDVWAKRALRLSTAERTVELTRLQLDDAVREITYAVRSAFAELEREQLEDALAHQSRERYDQTISISKKRFEAGDISQTEFQKIELEGMKYTSAELDADKQLDAARLHLAALLVLPPEASAQLVAAPEPKPTLDPLDALTTKALASRPDFKATELTKTRADATLASARREAYPDLSVGLAFTRSNFVVSGDNPSALSVTLGVPIPIFDRNQAAIAHATLDRRVADNEHDRVEHLVRSEVTAASHRAEQSLAMLRMYEGGMTERAETALRVAEKSYQVGSISLLEFLEAQRTALDIRAQYLDTAYQYEQAIIDVRHATGEHP